MASTCVTPARGRAFFCALIMIKKKAGGVSAVGLPVPPRRRGTCHAQAFARTVTARRTVASATSFLPLVHVLPYMDTRLFPYGETWVPCGGTGLVPAGVKNPREPFDSRGIVLSALQSPSRQVVNCFFQRTSGSRGFCANETMNLHISRNTETSHRVVMCPRPFIGSLLGDSPLGLLGDLPEPPRSLTPSLLGVFP